MMFDPPWAIGATVAAAAVIVFAGTRLSLLADLMGIRFGIGRAMAGSLFLGAVTSLSGITTSVVAALDGLPELAASNAVGGIAAQTVFLAVADMAYGRANLEHDATSASNILQGGLLVAVLGVALAITLGPDVTWLGIHPGTPLLVGCYIFGLRFVRKSADFPMWVPRGGEIPGVDEDPPEKAQKRSSAGLILEFGAVAAAVGGAGWLLATATGDLIEAWDLDGGAVGAIGTAVVTSLPELVTTLAAVRRGALTLAVGGIIGGNAFDILFLAGADVAYRPGSLYHAAGDSAPFLLAVTVLMTAVLIMGLVRRERSGPGNIGLESVILLGVYLAGSATLILW